MQKDILLMALAHAFSVLIHVLLAVQLILVNHVSHQNIWNYLIIQISVLFRLFQTVIVIKQVPQLSVNSVNRISNWMLLLINVWEIAFILAAHVQMEFVKLVIMDSISIQIKFAHNVQRDVANVLQKDVLM